MAIRTRKRGKRTVYQVQLYDPQTQRMEYVPGSTRYVKGTKAGRMTDDPAVSAYACEYQLELERQQTKRAGATLAELAPLWITAKSHSHAAKPWKGATAKHNEERISSLLERFGDQRPDAIDRLEALAWCQENPNRSHAARALVNWAREQGACTLNPFEKAGISRGSGRRDDEPLTEADLGHLLEACAVLGSYADEFRGFILFQAYVGCRPCEGLHVQRARHLNLERGEVWIEAQKRPDGSVDTPKNGRERTVILPDPARPALELIAHRIDSPWLFHNRSGDPLLYGTMLTYWQKVTSASGLAISLRWTDAAGVPTGIDPYHLRHFCGSHLADLGCSAQDIAEQLGHIDGGTLARELYIHTYSDRSRERLHDVYRQAPRPRLAALEGDTGHPSRAS
jgi:integrase